MRGVFGLALFAACGGVGTAPPPDGGGMSDSGADPNFALRVRWSAMPALPGPLGNNLAVTEARFQLLRLQVVGDASEGNATIARQLELTWDGNPANPTPIVFPQAPSGLYSQVAFRLDAEPGMSYEISGTAKVGGTDEPFHIVDTEELAISVSGFGVMLEPGRAAAIPVVLDLSRALSRVNFAQLPVVDGVRVLDQSNAQISQLRSDLVDAFAPAP